MNANDKDNCMLPTPQNLNNIVNLRSQSLGLSAHVNKVSFPLLEYPIKLDTKEFVLFIATTMANLSRRPPQNKVFMLACFKGNHLLKSFPFLAQEAIRSTASPLSLNGD